MSRDDDQTWAELVDSFHSSPAPEGDQPWPAAEEIGPDDEEPDDFGDASVTLSSFAEPDRPGGDPAEPTPEPAHDTPDDHFVPPTPAPIPAGDAVSRLAWAGVIGAPAWLIIVAIMSWRPPDELALFAVLAFIGGFVTLISRMRGRHPNDPDDGAVL